MSTWVRSAFDEREHAVAVDAMNAAEIVVAEFSTDHADVEDTGPIPAIVEAVEALCGARVTVSNGRHGSAERCERCEIVVAARETLSDLPDFAADEAGRGWFGRLFSRSAAEAR